MKKLLCLVLAVVLLAGCGKNTEENLPTILQESSKTELKVVENVAFLPEDDFVTRASSLMMEENFQGIYALGISDLNEDGMPEVIFEESSAMVVMQTIYDVSQETPFWFGRFQVPFEPEYYQIAPEVTNKTVWVISGESGHGSQYYKIDIFIKAEKDPLLWDVWDCVESSLHDQNDKVYSSNYEIYHNWEDTDGSEYEELLSLERVKCAAPVVMEDAHDHSTTFEEFAARFAALQEQYDKQKQAA